MSNPRWLRRLFDRQGADLILWQTSPVFARRPAKLKPRIRINANGWIRNNGAPFPFSPRTPVEVIFLGSQLIERVDYAEHWPESWWRNDASDWRYNIRWYRIVSDPVPPNHSRL